MKSQTSLEEENQCLSTTKTRIKLYTKWWSIMRSSIRSGPSTEKTRPAGTTPAKLDQKPSVGLTSRKCRPTCGPSACERREKRWQRTRRHLRLSSQLQEV